MEQPIETLTANPVYMAVAVVLAIIILMGVIKKLVKMALVVGAVLVLWIAYMVWTGQDVSVDKIKKQIQSGVESIGEKTAATGKEVVKSAQETVEQKVNEQTKKLIDQ